MRRVLASAAIAAVAILALWLARDDSPSAPQLNDLHREARAPAAAVTARFSDVEAPAIPPALDAAVDSPVQPSWELEVLALREALATNAAKAERYIGVLCDDVRELRQKPPFPSPPPWRRDAARFLAPLLDYEKPYDDLEGQLHLPDDLRQRIHSYGNQWLALISDGDLEGLDFEWMSSLTWFDHWSQLGEGPLRYHSADNPMSFPLPNYSSLMIWAKLRYAAAVRRGDLAKASAEVRHLAELIRSQGWTISEIVALGFYRWDAVAHQAAVASGADVSGWVPADLEQLERYKRLSLAAVAFVYPGVNAATARRALDCSPSPCATLIDGAAVNRSLAAFVPADHLQLLRELSREYGCDGALFERLASGRSIEPSEAFRADSPPLFKPDDLARRLGSPQDRIGGESRPRGPTW